jgi:hypothetical protein
MSRWDHNVERNVKEIGCEGVGVDRYSSEWEPAVGSWNAVMNDCVL